MPTSVGGTTHSCPLSKASTPTRSSRLSSSIDDRAARFAIASFSSSPIFAPMLPERSSTKTTDRLGILTSVFACIVTGNRRSSGVP